MFITKLIYNKDPYTYTFLEEWIIYQVGLIPSHFYTVLTERDKHGFYRLLWVSSIYIITTAVVS